MVLSLSFDLGAGATKAPGQGRSCFPGGLQDLQKIVGFYSLGLQVPCLAKGQQLASWVSEIRGRVLLVSPSNTTLSGTVQKRGWRSL